MVVQAATLATLSRMAFLLLPLAGCSSGGIDGKGAPRRVPFALGTVASGDFEDLPAGMIDGDARPWAAEEPDEIFIVNDNAAAHSGNQYVKMTLSTAQLMQMISVQPNTGYRVSI